MCRFEDDYEWMVASTDLEALSDKVERCEDCGRTIQPGEVHVVFHGEGTEQPDYAWFAQHPWDAESLFVRNDGSVHVSHHFHSNKPWVRIDEDDAAVWEALGYKVFDDDDPDWVPEQFESVSCSQCVIAARWLTKICDQRTVLVTREDLAEHWGEYDAKTLGPDFQRLNMLAQQHWRLAPGFNDLRAYPEYVRKLTTRAIAHAFSVGLDREPLMDPGVDDSPWGCLGCLAFLCSATLMVATTIWVIGRMF